MPATDTVVGILVPFREQREQDRAAQLRAFVEHMSRFLHGGGRARFIIVVAQQSDDGRAFNRGQLLNVAFREAQRSAAPAPLASAIFHDVDLLPSTSLLRWYQEPPAKGRPTHIAGPSTWRKYDMPGYNAVFFGGVTALHPADFEAANGYPNHYWGWGAEDDQLRLRVEASGGLGHGVLRPPSSGPDSGHFDDLDPIQMLSFLQSRESLMRHHQLFNPLMFEGHNDRSGSGGTRRLDEGWQKQRGLRAMRYEPTRRSERALSDDTTMVHVVARLGD